MDALEGCEIWKQQFMGMRWEVHIAEEGASVVSTREEIGIRSGTRRRRTIRSGWRIKREKKGLYSGSQEFQWSTAFEMEKNDWHV